MKECRYCRSIYDDSLAACPNCGGNKIITAEERAEEAELRQKEVENREKAAEAPIRQRKTIIGVIVAVVVVVAVVVGIVSYSANKPLSNGMSKDEGDQVLESGISFYETGDHEEALRCFVQLPLDSKQYEKAQSMLQKSSDAYCEEIAEKAEKYVQNGEYEVALELLDNAQALLPNATELQELHNTTYAAYKTFISTAAIESAETHIANDDYEAAINVLRDATSKVGADIELEALLSQYEKEYCTYVIQKADEALTAEGYEAAVAVINDGLSFMEDNETFLIALDRYKAYEPKSLQEFTVIGENAVELASDLKDVQGNSYNIAYSIGGNSIGSNSNYLEVYIAGDYNTFSGKFAPVDAWRWRTSYPTATVAIYGDDKILESFEISYKSLPFEFEVDVTGVSYLKVQMAEGSMWTNVLLADANLSIE